jgi:hypothetical protein
MVVRTVWSIACSDLNVAHLRDMIFNTGKAETTDSRTKNTSQIFSGLW